MKTIDNRGDKLKEYSKEETRNKKGLVNSIRHFDADGRCTKWEKFQYDRKGHQTLHQRLNPKDSVEISSSSTTYNRWGKVIEIVTVNDGVVDQIIRRKYDRKGKKVLELELDKSDQLILKKVYHYNNLGLLTRRVYFNAAGEEVYRREFEYSYR